MQINSAQENQAPRKETLQFVTFEIGSRDSISRMALNVQKIKEVVTCDTIFPFPGNPESILGIYDLRGCPVPVLNIHSFLKTTRPSSNHSRLLICDLQRIWIAIPVEKTGRILNCLSSDFLPPPSITQSHAQHTISGLIRKGSEYIPVLDLDSFLTSLGYELQSESSVKAVEPLFKGKQVLVVEDSRTIQKRLVQLFTQLGCLVASASNGEEALQALQKNNHAFDLVFTDIEMPLMDGVALARAIKTNPASQKIPIIIHSALSNPALISDIEKENLGHYLVKFDDHQLMEELNRVFKS